MKTLTVITTTYNRAYCLHRVYESLLRQTSDDFMWLIIDDGSSDNTKDLVEKWRVENRIKIEYYYKDNGGMHTARNMAYRKVYTPLNVVIDSDDWMTDDAVEKIVYFWEKNKSDCYSGIISNNMNKEGDMIGAPLPSGVKSCKSRDLREKYHVNGDKKLIFRSELTRRYPYPEFSGEKFYPASYKFILLDQDYEMLLMNDYTCVVDYNEDSMTFNKFSQYKSCCRGFSHFRNEIIRITDSPKYIIKNMIHYIAECKFAHTRHYIRKSSKPGYAVICWIPGQLYYIYLIHTRKKY